MIGDDTKVANGGRTMETPRVDLGISRRGAVVEEWGVAR
jgi:hypothetical protein